MKNDVWVVVANSTLAKIFKAETVKQLKEIETLIHPASRQHARDLTSDLPGRTFESTRTGTRHAMEPKTNPKQVEYEIFAKEVSHYLNQGFANGQYKKVYLAASPSFLGLLRQHLDTKTSQAIVNELDKDLTELETSQITKHFDITI